MSRRTVATDVNFTGTATDDSTATWAYDSLSRVVQEEQTIGSLSTKTFSCSYDIEVAAAGCCGGGKNLPSECIYPDGRKVHNLYDALDRLISKMDDGAGSAIVEYEYIGNRVLERNLQNGVNLDLKDGVGGTNYDGDRRPLVWDHTNGSTVIGFEMQYDRMNNKIVEEKLHDSINSEVYTYDSAYRVASLSSSYRSISTAFQRGTLNGAKTDISSSTTDGIVLAEKDWTIDGLGNWSSNSTTYNTGGFTGGTQTREDTNFNEYNKVGTIDRDHDENGNLIDGGGSNNAEYTLPENQKRFEYDYRNRLRKVFDNNGTPTNTGDDTELASYQYDGANRRIRKETTSSTAQGVSTTNYWYHDWQLWEESDGGDSITKQYVYGLYIDEPITLDDRSASVASLNDGSGSDRHFYHANIQFNVHGLTDETGALVEGYQYDPFGRHYLYTDGDSDGVVEWDGTDNIADAGASSVGNEYLYTGRRFDEETKIFYFRNRYYNPLSGRFISRDPIGFRGGINVYHSYFVLNGQDPMGQRVINGVRCLYWSDLYNSTSESGVVLVCTIASWGSCTPSTKKGRETCYIRYLCLPGFSGPTWGVVFYWCTTCK